MNLRKGMKILFISSNRTEVIEKGSSSSITGMVKTDREEYSCDFIRRQLCFGFAKLYNKKGEEILVKNPEFLS